MGTYSSRIQLPTELPPQLMPVTMLLARLSLRGFSRFEAFINIGCASLCCDPGVAPPRPPKKADPLTGVPLVSIAVVGRASLAEVDCRADVRFEVWLPRGESAREDVAMSMGVVRLAMFRTGGGSLKSGKEVSSKSESRRVEST